MKKLLCVGQSTYDITYIMDEFPLENRKYKIDSTKMMGGGPSGNAAYLLGKYKENVSHITTLGKDLYGEEIIKEFKSVNVDLNSALISEKYHTPCSMIITNIINGTRTILNHREKNYIPNNFILKYKTPPKIILFDGHELEIARKTLKEFPEAITVLDAGSFKESCVELGEKVTYLVSSEDFAREYAKVDIINDDNILDVFSTLEILNKNNVVITLGEKGCIFRIEEEIFCHPAYITNTVDTTGAGDIFHGAFVYALSNNFDFIKSIKFSTVCASLSVEKIGGRESIPNLNEVFQRMDNWDCNIIKLK